MATKRTARTPAAPDIAPDADRGKVKAELIADALWRAIEPPGDVSIHYHDSLTDTARTIQDGWVTRRYVVGVRNGYWAVDAETVKGGRSTGFRTIQAGLTRKQAELLAYHLNDAVYLFMADNKLV